MTAKKSRNVEHNFHLRASPSRVFDMISTPRGLAQWMVERAEFAPVEGARYVLEFHGGWTHHGRVLRARPGRLLALSWEWPGVPLTGTVLTFAVRPTKGGTILHLTHSGFPNASKWVDLYGVTEWGWTYYGMNLKSVLEAGRDLRSGLDN